MQARILLIDDNQDAVELLQILLRHLGYEVQVAYSGEQGLELAETFLPDVIISDLGMPGMLGYEVAKRVRKHATLNNTLLLALTGWNDASSRQEIVAAGFDRHFRKPIELTLLQSTLDEFFGHAIPSLNNSTDCEEQHKGMDYHAEILLARARTAYAKRGLADKPCRQSNVREVDGIPYVILRNGPCILAVYRYDGVNLKRLADWPDQLS